MARIYINQAPDGGYFAGDRELRKRLMRVLRLRVGDRIEVVAAGGKWECELAEATPEAVRLRVIREIPGPPPSKLELTLAQAIPKGDRFDWVIEKSTELGIRDIYPLITERSVVRPSNAQSRLQRWNEIAEQAAGQSENSHPALVHPPLPLRDFLALPYDGLKLLLHEREQSEPLGNVLAGYAGNHIMFVVGPEGGWSPAEAAAMADAGFARIHLGPRVLRADTSGLVVASILNYIRGDFSG